MRKEQDAGQKATVIAMGSPLHRDGEGVGGEVDRVDLALVAAIVVGATLLLYIPTFWAANLGPFPDAGEYAFAARTLAHFHPYTIALYGADYPPRYPFGFSALLVPWYWLPGSTLANGVYGVLALGVATLALIYALARRIAGRIAGVAAALAALLSPQYLAWNHEVMSETATMAIVAAIALLLHAVGRCDTRGRRTLLLALLGGLAGVAILVRLANIVVLVAVGAALCADPRCRAEGRRAAIAFGAGPALALLALAGYAQATFGGVTGTGYRYWVPYWYAALGRTFSPRYAFSSPGVAGDSFAPADIPNLLYYARGLIGRLPLASLDFFSPWWAFLALLGGVVIARDRRRPVRMVGIFGGVFAVLTIGLYALYFFQSVRFMAPLLPLLAVAAGVAVQRAALLLRDGVRRRTVARGALPAGTALGAVALLGVLTAVGPALAGSYLYRWYVRQDRAPYPTPADARTAALYRAVVPAGGVIVTDLFPLILAGTPVADRATVIPLSRRDYLLKPPLEGVPTFLRREQEVKAALRAGVPVFTDNYTLVFLPAGQRQDRAHQAIVAYGRTPVADDGGLVVYRLSADAAVLDAVTPLDPLLIATPNPVPPGTEFGATTIAWDTGDGSMGQVYVSYDGGPVVLLDEGASGEHHAPWIRRGSTYTFTLYRGTKRDTALQRVTVMQGD